jgi:hypothetical protein
MTYGHWLDQATDALHAAGHAAAQTGADGHPSVAAAIAARTNTYRQLVRLVDHIGGPVAGPTSVAAADQLVNSTRRLSTTSTARLLGVGLRATYTNVPTPAVGATHTDAVGANLADAADRLGIAADILASHLGHPRTPPRTPEGRMIAAGTGQHSALADIARLASQAIETDRRLLSWLARGRPARTLRPVYQPVADRLRWWTRGPYPRLLQRIADSSSGQSVLRLLEPAPATERSTGPRPITSLRDLLDTIDATHTWLQQHPQTRDLAYARAVTRLAVTITRGVTDLNPQGHSSTGGHAYRWEQIAKKLHNIAELDRGRHDHLVHELVAANDWLHHELRARKATGSPNTQHWHDALSTMQDKLPALAAQLNHVVGAAVTQGQVCVSQAELDMTAPRRGIFLAKARWRRAAPADDAIQALRHELDDAARTPIDREQALRQALGNPVAIARSAFPQPLTPGGATATPAPIAASDPSQTLATRGGRNQRRG